MTALCECGCGEPVVVYGRKPNRFVYGHWKRKPNKILIEDRGYETPCWTWQLSLAFGGYAATYDGVSGRVRKGHRVYYERDVGPIPDGLDLDHLCRNRACVNPAHLEPVTRRENLRRGDTSAARTHCPQGHAYDEDNTYVIPSTGNRLCRTCRRDGRRRRYHERKLVAIEYDGTKDA